MLAFFKKTHNKIGHWVRFSPPGALTFSGWDSFNAEFKQKAPVRYWFNHDLLRKFRQLRRAASDAVHWVRYRTTDRYHVVQTGLQPGYAEIDRRILHANFSLLKDYVEIELALFYHMLHDTKGHTRGRDPEAGAAYLRDKVGNNEHYDDILDLYTWWTVTRPARAEIHIPEFDTDGALTPEYLAFRKAVEQQSDLDDVWYQEDTDQLVRLIKLRRHLWT